MTIQDLEELVSETTVLSPDEINNKLSEKVLKKTLQIINSFYPKLVNMMNYDANIMGNYKIWDITTDPISHKSIDTGLSINSYLGTDFPSSIVAVDWTLETISSSHNTWLIDMLEQLFTAKYVEYCANKRRQANINDLPFDMRGDDFYNEANERVKELTNILINSTPQIL